MVTSVSGQQVQTLTRKRPASSATLCSKNTRTLFPDEKTHVLILFVLAITAIAAVSFPYAKKALEIRSETRKWKEKWADRAAVPSAEEFPSLAQASKVPESIEQDLFLRNMMVSEQNMSKLYVMNAPRGYFRPQIIMRKRRAFDLASLDSAATQSFSRSQRMRFMPLYLGCNRLTDEDKQLIRRVLTMSEPMRERQIKRLERSIAFDENGKPESS